MAKANVKNKSTVALHPPYFQVSPSLLFHILTAAFSFCCGFLSDDLRGNNVVEGTHGFKSAGDSQVRGGEARQSATSQLPKNSLRSVEKFGEIGEAVQGEELLQTFLSTV